MVNPSRIGPRLPTSAGRIAQGRPLSPFDPPQQQNRLNQRPGLPTSAGPGVTQSSGPNTSDAPVGQMPNISPAPPRGGPPDPFGNRGGGQWSPSNAPHSGDDMGDGFHNLYGQGLWQGAGGAAAPPPGIKAVALPPGVAGGASVTPPQLGAFMGTAPRNANNPLGIWNEPTVPNGSVSPGGTLGTGGHGPGPTAGVGGGGGIVGGTSQQGLMGSSAAQAPQPPQQLLALQMAAAQLGAKNYSAMQAQPPTATGNEAVSQQGLAGPSPTMPANQAQGSTTSPTQGSTATSQQGLSADQNARDAQYQAAAAAGQVSAYGGDVRPDVIRLALAAGYTVTPDGQLQAPSANGSVWGGFVTAEDLNKAFLPQANLNQAKDYQAKEAAKPKQDPNAIFNQLLQGINEVPVPQLDQGAVQQQNKADAALRAEQMSRQLRMAAESGAGTGMSPEAMMGYSGGVAHQNDVETAASAAHNNMQAALQNFQARAAQYSQRASALMAVAQMANSRDQQQAAFAQAKQMQSLAEQAQQQMVQYQWQLQNTITPASLLGDFGGLLGGLGGAALGGAFRSQAMPTGMENYAPSGSVGFGLGAPYGQNPWGGG